MRGLEETPIRRETEQIDMQPGMEMIIECRLVIILELPKGERGNMLNPIGIVHPDVHRPLRDHRDVERTGQIFLKMAIGMAR